MKKTLSKKKIIVGLVGEKGSGKETVGNLLIGLFPQKRIIRVRSSDILRETLDEWGLEPTRHNLQHLAIVMDKGFGHGTLSTAIKKRLDSIPADMVIFDGMRWETDIKLLKSFDKNLLVYVTATPEIRYARIKKRKEKAGEDTVSFKQFLKEEKIVTETHISALAKKADRAIFNDSDLSYLRFEVKKLLVDIHKLGL